MKNICILLGLLFVIHLNGIGQKACGLYELMDSMYGKDPTLYKGPKYLAERRCDFGHPFVFGEDFKPGTISLQGQVYNDLLLNYDVFEQVLILQYSNYLGANEQLIMNADVVDWFKIGNRKFVKNLFVEVNNPFVELMGDKAGVQCLVSYSKRYGFENKNGDAGFGYSDIAFSKYIFQNGELFKFKTKKQFLKELSDWNNDEMNGYVKKLKWNIRKMDGAQLLLLCTYLNDNYFLLHD